MPTIRIDNKPYQVKEGQNLLHAALSQGLDIPYFCWHPSLGSVGACRQCAVIQYKDDKDTQGRIVMSCMTPATEGACFSINHPEAKAFRAGIVELLMTNHPHDCPVCDEGGECHLQDMTVMTGHNYRRYRFKKRTFTNQYLGPFINHEMNRCITCYRCVRFYRDHAGGTDLNAFASSNRVYFGRHEDGVLENEFSGNLVEVCPTGVFTDKTYKQHYTRKWDLQTAPSVCQSCGLGCNIISGERYGSLRRVANRYHHEVNGYFICDRGRFGYEYVNSKERLLKPLARANKKDEKAQEVSREAALEKIKSLFTNPNKGVIGIGSPRASLESNYALRTMVGAQNFYNGMSTQEAKLTSQILHILQNGPARTPTIHDVEVSDCAVVLGEDLTNTGARLALALRQSVRQKPVEEAIKTGIPQWNDAAIRNAIQQSKGPLFQATTSENKLDDVTTESFHGTPEELAILGFAVAHELNPKAPKAEGATDKIQQLAKRMAEALKNAKRPVIISGTSLNHQGIIEAAANIAWALCQQDKKAGLCYVVPEANSMGLTYLSGKTLDEAFKLASDGKVQGAIILENDLYRRAHPVEVTKFFETLQTVVALDHLMNPTVTAADVALPVTNFAEGAGTLISNEGRAQRYYRVYAPKEPIQESWRWLRDNMKAIGLGQKASWENLDQISDVMCADIASLHLIPGDMPRADYRVNDQKIARETLAYSGRTAMNANISVHEPKPPVDPDSPMTHTMEGFTGIRPAELTSFYWRPGWNSVQSLNKFQAEVGGPTLGGDGDAGVRLIEPKIQNMNFQYYAAQSGSVSSSGTHGKIGAKGECLVVPMHHIFGSEELSAHSPPLAKRMPAPYLAINSEDVKNLKIEESNKMVKLTLDGKKYRLPVKVMSGLPRGVVGFPVGFPDSCWVNLPTMGQLDQEM